MRPCADRGRMQEKKTITAVLPNTPYTATLCASSLLLLQAIIAYTSNGSFFPEKLTNFGHLGNCVNCRT